MRIYDAATLASLNARAGTITQRLVWISARNADTQAVEAIGLWSGDYNLTITLEGEARTYLGVGAVLQGDPISAQPGLMVRVHQLRLAAVSPEVETLVKGYETRFAPVEIHRAVYDPETRALVGTPHRAYRGLINGIDFPRATPGGTPSCVVSVVSETRILTRALATKKSDESHKERGGDRFRRYGDISGSVVVYWGELRAMPPADPVPAAPHVSTAENSGK